MGAEADARVATPGVLARAVGVRPLYLVESAKVSGLAIARWRFPSFRALEVRNPESILSYRTGGAGCATKTAGGRTIRKRPRIGSLTFLPCDGGATWTLDGVAEVVHMYLPPGDLQRFAEANLGGARTARINDFFAIQDPWLDGYFRMLASEFEGRDAEQPGRDSLLLDETVHLVSRHLLRWHSDAGLGARRELDLQTKVNPLRPALVRRVEEYVDHNLERDIVLPELARLCCMSVDHFLRSYRAARGITPYRYVLEQRLRRASTLLQTTPEAVAAIAAKCGFHSPSHFSTKFHAAFGVSPTHFRRASE
jgi:AraC family transcriptional regulator